MWKYKSSSVGVLVILLAHKSFPALADKWTWWPARSFPSLSYMVVHVEALEHHCCCLLVSQLASGKESVSQWLGKLANWLWVVCWLRRPLFHTFIACRKGLSIIWTCDCLEIAGLCDDLGIIALCIIVFCCPLNLKCSESKVWQFLK